MTGQRDDAAEEANQQQRAGGDVLVAEESKKAINILLETKPEALLKLTPRRYQTELCSKALEGNVIVYLGTGLGKTYIVVMFLRSSFISEQIRLGRKVVFLTPTQDLTRQQAEYIHLHVQHRVKVYCGRTCQLGTHIDHWDRPTWDAEWDRIDVLVMTPQIFSSAISSNLLDWTRVAALVMDECHHTIGRKKESNHPYAQIMRHYDQFYRLNCSSPKPRIVGLTASLVNNMPKNVDEIGNGVVSLELRLKARCVTDLEVQESKPLIVIHGYGNSCLDSLSDIVCQRLSRYSELMKLTLDLKQIKRLEHTVSSRLTKSDVMMLSYYNRLKLAAMGISLKPGSFPKVLNDLVRVRKKTGMWTTRVICSKLITALEKHVNSTCISSDLKPIYQDFMKLLQALRDSIGNLIRGTEAEELTSLTQPKLMTLLDILKDEHRRTVDGSSKKSGFSCIIFVHSRLEVVALDQWLKMVSMTLPEFEFLKSDYAIGLAAASSSKYSCVIKRRSNEQARMLEEFRRGNLNVIVTTSVLEEGIDLPVCSTVIRYDPATTFRIYVQSRGRARQKISSYITMCEKDLMVETTTNLRILNDFETRVKAIFTGERDIAASSRTSDDIIRNMRDRSCDSLPLSETMFLSDFFMAKAGKICVWGNNARIILFMYCNKIARRNPFTDGIRYDRVKLSSGLFLTTIYMPPGCPIQQGIQGNAKGTEELADDSAIVAAYKALFESGELNEFGVPSKMTDESVDQLLSSAKLIPEMVELNPFFAGKVVVEDGRELILFDSALYRQVEFLSRGYMDKVYRLLRIKFVPNEGKVRADTSQYFEDRRLSLIIGSSMHCPIPSVMYGHYGEFRIECEQVCENMVIRTNQEHSDLLNYTHLMLTRCLSIGRVSKDEFKQSCLFYFALLDRHNKPDFTAMGKASRRPFNHKLQVGDIVKLPYQLDQLEDDKRQRGRLLLVRGVRHDLSPNSLIPGMKSTFLEHAKRKYGNQNSTPKAQPIMEVMPISKEFATSRRGKKIEVLHSTPSVFMMSSQLELLTDDAASLFQAFYLPEILYKLYLGHMASKIDARDHLSGVQAEIYAPEVEQQVDATNEADVDPGDLDEDAPAQDQSASVASKESEIHAEGAENVEDAGEESEDETHEESIDDSDADYSSDASSDEEFKSDLQLKDMVAKKSLEFNPERKREPEKWDFKEYDATDLKPLQYELKESRNPEPRLWDVGHSKLAEFELAMGSMDSISAKIVESLKEIKVKLLADSPYLGEDLDLQHMYQLVDHSIEPPMRFDRNVKPIREAPRDLALIEALTQRRALESYSLEGLENIGDSFLKYIVSVVLIKSLQDSDEGVLTAARSRLTCNETFTHLARQNSLGSFVITRPFDKNLLCDLMNGVRKHPPNRLRAKELADMFESLVGCHLVYGSEYEALSAIKALGLNIFKDEMFSERHKGAVTFAPCPSALLADLPPEVRHHYDSCKSKLAKFERVLGYTFNDKSHLIQALTHASWPTKSTRSYERLEFLGDAILDFLVTISLYSTGKITEPGQLTMSRSQLVSNVNFARLALKYRYDLFILYSNHALYSELTRVKQAVEEDPDADLDVSNFDQITKLLGDIFESVAGAVYLDSGCSLDTLWAIYYPMLKEQLDKEIEAPTKNKKMMLHETFPGKDHIQFDRRINAEGLTVVECKIEGFKSFEGVGATRRQATTRAIDKALQNAPSADVLKKLNAKYIEDHPDLFLEKPRDGRRGGRSGFSRGGQSRGGRPRGGLSRGGQSRGFPRNRGGGGGGRLDSRPPSRDRARGGFSR